MKKKNIQLAQSIEKLKSTQEQLVHHEKLASMGRLSAGIAHEMRNPLNFVNNFSEITSQMLDEMEMVDTEEERKLIIGTLKSNVSKISQHGKRAEMIVKQIIDHVQTSAGTRELCNINQLCDYYIKMVLHSMSMHKVEFHHKINKQYAPDIPMISVNSQEIGRVLMNIFSNAFQAIEDKLLTGSFLPEITISTGCQNNALFVEVKDNGMGIKKDLLKKIADPFFTTRAPGQGAGLGLSVAHDIIRSYGGSIAVESVENEFTSIRIQIPL
jgi:signal transduction histidine kinase